LPTPPSQPSQRRTFRRWRAYLLSSPFRSGAFFGAVTFLSLVIYSTFLSSRGPLWLRPPWHGFSQHEGSIVPDVLDLEHTEPTTTVETSYPSPSPSPIPYVLTVEQIRDIVVPTRGFFARDYSLGLGWNNVSVCGVPI